MLRIGKVIAVTETRCQSAYCLSIALSFSRAALISGPAEATWPARMSLIWLPTGWRADAARCVTPTNFVTWPPVLGFWFPQLLLYIKHRHNTTQRFPVKKHTCARTKISSRPNFASVHANLISSGTTCSCCFFFSLDFEGSLQEWVAFFVTNWRKLTLQSSGIGWLNVTSGHWLLYAGHFNECTLQRIFRDFGPHTVIQWEFSSIFEPSLIMTWSLKTICLLHTTLWGVLITWKQPWWCPIQGCSHKGWEDNKLISISSKMENNSFVQ